MRDRVTSSVITRIDIRKNFTTGLFSGFMDLVANTAKSSPKCRLEITMKNIMTRFIGTES